jgi:hypothetical protein
MTTTCSTSPASREPWLFDPCTDAQEPAAVSRNDVQEAPPIVFMNSDARTAAQINPPAAEHTDVSNQLARFNTKFSLSVTGGVLGGAAGAPFCGPPCALLGADIGQTLGLASAQLMLDGRLNMPELNGAFMAGMFGGGRATNLAARAVFNGVVGNGAAAFTALLDTHDVGPAFAALTRPDSFALNAVLGEVPHQVATRLTMPKLVASGSTTTPPVEAASVPRQGAVPGDWAPPPSRTIKEPGPKWNPMDLSFDPQLAPMSLIENGNGAGNGDGLPPGPGRPPVPTEPTPTEKLSFLQRARAALETRVNQFKEEVQRVAMVTRHLQVIRPLPEPLRSAPASVREVQMADAIRDGIRSGHFKPSERLGNVASLSDGFDQPAVQVSKVVRDLMAEGLLEPRFDGDVVYVVTGRAPEPSTPTAPNATERRLAGAPTPAAPVDVDPAVRQIAEMAVRMRYFDDVPAAAHGLQKATNAAQAREWLQAIEQRGGVERGIPAALVDTFHAARERARYDRQLETFRTAPAAISQGSHEAMRAFVLQNVDEGLRNGRLRRHDELAVGVLQGGGPGMGVSQPAFDSALQGLVDQGVLATLPNAYFVTGHPVPAEVLATPAAATPLRKPAAGVLAHDAGFQDLMERAEFTRRMGPEFAEHLLVGHDRISLPTRDPIALADMQAKRVQDIDDRLPALKAALHDFQAAGDVDSAAMLRQDIATLQDYRHMLQTAEIQSYANAHTPLFVRLFGEAAEGRGVPLKTLVDQHVDDVGRFDLFVVAQQASTTALPLLKHPIVRENLSAAIDEHHAMLSQKLSARQAAEHFIEKLTVPLKGSQQRTAALQAEVDRARRILPECEARTQELRDAGLKDSADISRDMTTILRQHVQIGEQVLRQLARRN